MCGVDWATLRSMPDFEHHLGEFRFDGLEGRSGDKVYFSVRSEHVTSM